MVLIFLVMPVVVYVSLCLLPRGRGAAGGITVALVALAGVWVATGAGGDGFFGLAVLLAAGAAALAAVVQLLRWVFGPWQARWPYPLLAGLALIAAGLPTLGLLGM